MTAKDADRMATSLMKSHREEDVIEAIASLDEYALIEAYKAKSTIGYLRTCLNDALERLGNPPVDNPEPVAEDDHSPSPMLYFSSMPEDKEVLRHLTSIPEGERRKYVAECEVPHA